MRAKITSLIFTIMLIGFFVLVMILPKDEKASVQENRPLAEMPEFSAHALFSGDFTTAFETFLTDNVGFRSSFVGLGTAIEKSRGIQIENMGQIVTLAGGNRLLLNDGKIMEIYKENPAANEKYIGALNGYGAKLGENADLYLMLVPTQMEFDQTSYRRLADSQKQTIDKIYSALDGFKTVNVYDKLANATNEYIYFRTDHHWTQRGAYYGYSALMEKKGISPVALGDLKHTKAVGFLGYLYNQANAPQYSQYADDIEYFRGKNNYKVKAKSPDENGNLVEYETNIYCPPEENKNPTYGIFMGGDHAFAEIDTTVKNGETALVIKDSYANTVIPLLTNNYEKILVVDPRSFDGSVKQLVDEYKVCDVIIINYVFSTTFEDFIQHINDIL